MPAPEAPAGRARGRPPVFSERALRDAAHFSYARQVRSRRGAQDLVYRKFAVAALELYRETHPEEGERLEWLLTPIPRHSILTELGRVARPWSDEHGVLHWTAQDVARLVEVAFAVVDVKPSAKDGVAMVRELKRRRDPAA